MPIYEWSCKKCKKSVDIIRSFAEYENGPAEDELPAVEEEPCEHEWFRNIGDNTTVVKGNGWGSGKGSW